MKEHILLVEDDVMISKAYRYALEHAGYEVTCAMDGTEAIEEIKNKKFNLILIDLIIPFHNGFEILEWIKKEKIETAPVIVVSNLGQEADKARCAELGAIDFLVKSDVSLSNMVLRVKSHLARINV